MSRLFIDGFEDGNEGCWNDINKDTNKLYVVNKTSSIFNTYEFSPVIAGDYALFINAQTNVAYINKLFTQTLNEIYIKFKFQYLAETASTLNQFIQLFATQNRSFGYIELYNNHFTYNPTRAGRIVFPYFQLDNCKWYTLELYIKFHASEGVVTLRVNEMPYTVTNINTTSSNPISIDFYKIQIGPKASLNYRYLFDDFVFENTQFPGDSHIKANWPNAEGTPQEFVLGEGENKVFAVNLPGTVVDVDETFIVQNTPSRSQTYIVDNIENDVSIYSIQIHFRNSQQNNPTAKYLIPYIKHIPSDTFQYGETHLTLVDTVKTFTHPWTTNPFDSNNPFTTNAVNNLHVGVVTA